MRACVAWVAAAIAAAACSKSETPTSNIQLSSTQGTVAVEEDPVTCANYGTGPVQIFIDGTNVATPVMSPGVPVSYFVTPGTHAIIARDEDQSYQWPTSTITVAADASVTVKLTCV